MTKYYTMKKCFDACGDDDFPQNEDYDFNIKNPFSKKDLIGLGSYDLRLPSIGCAISDKWQIKRAKPKVSRPKEIIDRYKYSYSDQIYLSTALIIAKECHENGRLEEWQRKEQVELREAVEDWAFNKNDNEHFRSQYLRIRKAFKNLKPPHERGGD